MKSLLFAVAVCSAAFAEAPSAIALRDARVVTVSGATLERGTVILRDGLIEAVGAAPAIPADAWVIDCKGLTVYPGLIDALLPSEPEKPRTPPTPGTPPPAPPPARGPEDRPDNTSWLRAADILNPSDKRLEEARNAGFTSAAVFPPNGIFAGEGALVNTAGERRRMVVASATGQYLTLATRSFISYPGSLLGVMAYIRQVYLDARHYTVQKAAYERREAGVRRPDYDRALEGVLESPRALLPARNGMELDRMARFAADLKLNAVLYGADGGYEAADELARLKIPVLVNLKWPVREKDADPDTRESLRVLEHREKAPGTPAALAKAGARFAFYTGGVAAKELPAAVKRARQAGLTEAQLARAFTLSAAEIYGVEGRLGSIEKGKIANLLVTDGELFGEKTKVRYVFVDGAKFVPPPVEEPKGGAK